MPIKILAVSNFFPPDAKGGAERVLFNIANSLSNKDYYFKILTKEYSGSAGSEQLINNVEVSRCLRFHTAPPKNIFGRLRHLVFDEYYDPYNANLIKEQIREYKPDILYLNAPTGLSHSPFYVMSLLKIPMIVHIHDYWLRDFLIHRKLGWINKILFNSVLHSKIKIVGVSEYVTQSLIKAGVPENLTAVNLNALQDDFSLVSEEKLSDRAGVVYCGRISPAKGIHIISQMDIDLDLYGAGNNDYLDKCINNSTGKINYLGKLDHKEIHEKLQQYAVLVLPSVWEEPCPLILLEAMASGCVPVASNIGGIPEIIGTGNDAAGLLVPAGEPAEFKKAVLLLLSDNHLRMKYAVNGLRRIKELFGWKKFIERVEKLFKLGAR